MTAHRQGLALVGGVFRVSFVIYFRELKGRAPPQYSRIETGIFDLLPLLSTGFCWLLKPVSRGLILWGKFSSDPDLG